MAGIPAHPRDAAFLRDVKLLRSRGLTWAAIASQLGMSRSTLDRIRRETGTR